MWAIAKTEFPLRTSDSAAPKTLKPSNPPPLWKKSTPQEKN